MPSLLSRLPPPSPEQKGVRNTGSTDPANIYPTGGGQQQQAARAMDTERSDCADRADARRYHMDAAVLDMIAVMAHRIACKCYVRPTYPDVLSN